MLHSTKERFGLKSTFLLSTRSSPQKSPLGSRMKFFLYYKTKIILIDFCLNVTLEFVFRTKIYHPNIDEKGQVCLPIIMAENWKPATKTDQGYIYFCLEN